MRDKFSNDYVIFRIAREREAHIRRFFTHHMKEKKSIKKRKKSLLTSGTKTAATIAIREKLILG